MFYHSFSLVLVHGFCLRLLKDSFTVVRLGRCLEAPVLGLEIPGLGLDLGLEFGLETQVLGVEIPGLDLDLDLGLEAPGLSFGFGTEAKSLGLSLTLVYFEIILSDLSCV